MPFGRVPSPPSLGVVFGVADLEVAALPLVEVDLAGVGLFCEPGFAFSPLADEDESDLLDLNDLFSTMLGMEAKLWADDEKTSDTDNDNSQEEALD